MDRPRPWLCILFVAASLLAGVTETWARSSGGYSRPSASRRTPTFDTGGFRGGFGSRSGGYRTPSTRSSGGYGLPSSTYGRQRYTPPSSAGDQSFSQERSGSAFDTFNRQRSAPRQAPYTPSAGSSSTGTSPSYVPSQPWVRRPSTQPSYPTGGYVGGGYGSGYAAPGGWYANRGWSVPPYAGGQRSFGVWDGLFLWALLNNLSRPGASDWFHNNQNDPGYQQWRQEVDRQAQDNAELRGRLDELDRQLKSREGEARTPGALPPDVPPDVAEAQPTRTPDLSTDADGGQLGTTTLLVLVALGGGAILIGWAAMRSTRSASNAAPSALGTVGAVLRHKVSGEGYTPSRFRVGMTLALDPTPFVLAGSAIKLRQPQGSGGDQVSVEAVGRVVSGGTQLVRLYLADGHSLVQIHLDAAGDPDECRLFGTIDEVTPADAGEWGAWLDETEGMIGWPEFQTKDGKLYDRVWSPGESRVAPRLFTETVESLSGTRTVESRTMLYAAATGVQAPGPVTEYIMVSAVKDGARARVEVRSGIDINPATLQLV